VQPGSPYPTPAEPSWSGGAPASGPPGYPPAPPPAPSPARKLRLGDLLVTAGGFLIFAFSFAPFVSYSDKAVAAAHTDASGAGFDGWYMAWSPQMFMAPLTWWIILSGLVGLVLALLRMLTGRDFTLLGFRDAQLQVGFGLFAFFALIGYALSHKQVFFGLDNVFRGSDPTSEDFRPGFAWGGVLMLVGAVVALAGAFLNHFNVGPAFAARLPAASGSPAAFRYRRRFP